MAVCKENIPLSVVLKQSLFTALQNKSHEDLVDNLAQYFRLVVQVADKDLLADVLQDCSADQVQVLQDVMTSK